MILGAFSFYVCGQCQRSLHPGVRVVVGGYDPSLAPEAYTDTAHGRVDFIVRGEVEAACGESCLATVRTDLRLFHHSSKSSLTRHAEDYR